MKTIFQQKYILRIVTFLVFTLALVNILVPKIKDYYNNSENQVRVSFGLPNEPPLGNAGTFFLIILFLSLLFTKRILFSFLFVFLFCIQSLLFSLIVAKLYREHYYFAYPASLYFELLFLIFIWFVSFGSAHSLSKKFQAKTF